MPVVYGKPGRLHHTFIVEEDPIEVVQTKSVFEVESQEALVSVYGTAITIKPFPLGCAEGNVIV